MTAGKLVCVEAEICRLFIALARRQRATLANPAQRCYTADKAKIPASLLALASPPPSVDLSACPRANASDCMSRRVQRVASHSASEALSSKAATYHSSHSFLQHCPTTVSCTASCSSATEKTAARNRHLAIFVNCVGEIRFLR